MSDNLRRDRAIRAALAPWYPTQPQGHLARHLHPLAALLSGIVARKSAPLPPIAPHGPDGTKAESRVKHFPGGSATTTSWRRCIVYRMRTACCVLERCRRWYSSWMAASGAAVASL